MNKSKKLLSLLEEFMITKERASQILNNKQEYGGLKYSFRTKEVSPNSPVFQDGITPEEDNYIKQIWKTMPGTTSYHDALIRISKGNI